MSVCWKIRSCISQYDSALVTLTKVLPKPAAKISFNFFLSNLSVKEFGKLHLNRQVWLWSICYFHKVQVILKKISITALLYLLLTNFKWQPFKVLISKLNIFVKKKKAEDIWFYGWNICGYSRLDYSIVFIYKMWQVQILLLVPNIFLQAIWTKPSQITVFSFITPCFHNAG